MRRAPAKGSKAHLRIYKAWGCSWGGAPRTDLQQRFYRIIGVLEGWCDLGFQVYRAHAKHV